MRLTDLSPVWFPMGGASRAFGAFMFLCPCCRGIWLTCKIIPADEDEQDQMMASRGITPPEYIPTPPDQIWTVIGDFSNMTISPGIDASASGHWTGKIQNGAIVH